MSIHNYKIYYRNVVYNSCNIKVLISKGKSMSVWIKVWELISAGSCHLKTQYAIEFVSVRKDYGFTLIDIIDVQQKQIYFSVQGWLR